MLACRRTSMNAWLITSGCGVSPQPGVVKKKEPSV
jgi:hypothetical protein